MGEGKQIFARACKRFLKTFAYGEDIIAQVFESVKWNFEIFLE
jgi:hypothetical protein